MKHENRCGLCYGELEWVGSEPFCQTNYCVNSAWQSSDRALKAYLQGRKDAIAGKGLYHSGPFCAVYLMGARGDDFPVTPLRTLARS